MYEFGDNLIKVNNSVVFRAQRTLLRFLNVEGNRSEFYLPLNCGGRLYLLAHSQGLVRLAKPALRLPKAVENKLCMRAGQQFLSTPWHCFIA